MDNDLRVTCKFSNRLQKNYENWKAVTLMDRINKMRSSQSQ